MPSLAANECRRQLRYNYTPDERIAKSIAHAECLNDIDSTNAELDRIKADYKARLAAIESEEAMLRGCVQSGYEMREYLCFWEYDKPRPGRKTLRKREGGDLVAEEDMTEHDRQMVMQIIDAEAAAAEGDRREKLALPAPKEWPETLQDLYVDGITTEDDWILNLIQTLFTNYNNTILPKDTVTKLLFDEVTKYLSEKEAIQVRDFIRAHELGARPGWALVLDVFGSFLDARAAAKAARKSKAKKGRLAGGAGTVDVPSDEGSRDDMGEDSKNNL